MLIDSHCHLDFPKFDDDRDDIINRARAAGIGRMVTISTRVKQFDPVLAIAEAHDDIYCSIGTHPHYADQENDVKVEHLTKIAAHPKVVGIGEAGLDYHYDNSPRADQAASFRIHIEAARQTGLPLIIHTRDADDDTARILQEEHDKGPFKILLHCFTAGKALAECGVALGGYVSFSGVLTFKNSDDLRAIAKQLPADRILVETDAPYLTPEPKRGRRNEPAYVVHTAQKLAQVRGVGFDDIERRTTENFFRLFDKIPAAADAA
jgi:TatD DNase family protein